jgi:hypothetical protein
VKPISRSPESRCIRTGESRDHLSPDLNFPTNREVDVENPTNAEFSDFEISKGSVSKQCAGAAATC